MKNILILFISFFLTTSLFSDDITQKQKIEAKLISTTLSKLFKYKLKVYTNKKYIKDVISLSEGKLEYVDNCKESDLIITDSIPKDCKEGKVYLFFTYNYDFLKNNKDVLGGLFWAKGRVSVIFVRERLEEHGIIVPEDLKKYLEYLEYL